jgi:pimeloyl-ACP methyl ester carboxylesterase
MGNPRPVSLVMHHGHAGDPETFARLVSTLSLIPDGFEGSKITMSCPISPSYNGIASWWHPDAFGPSAADLHSVQIPDGPVVLGGFSQGAAYAAALAVHRPNVVGLIVVAGFLPDPAPALDRPLPTLSIVRMMKQSTRSSGHGSPAGPKPAAGRYRSPNTQAGTGGHRKSTEG